MRLSRKIFVTLLLSSLTMSAMAKHVSTEHMYMFGFSASFKDNSIYLTDIQDVKGAWIDTKTKFLLGRDSYSQQMRDYLATNLQQPGRVCVVVYATNRKKAEKKFRKFKRIYIEKGSYDVRNLTEAEFSFRPEVEDAAE